MRRKRIKLKKIIYVLLIALAVIALAIFLMVKDKGPLKIGVLLDLSGPNAADPDEILDWSLKRINSHGGVNGRMIELVRKDTAKGDIKQLARELLRDGSIKVVIGPSTSEDVFKVGAMFLNRRKLLISPMATSGDIYRAFCGDKIFWRTMQGDQAQAKVIISALAKKGVKKIALMSENTAYGKTFYDWVGFFATEAGIEVICNHKFQPGSGNSLRRVAEALKGGPEYLICAAFPEDAVKIKKALDELGSKTKLLFTDSAETRLLIKEFGEKSEGIELVSPGILADSGFEEAYKEDFGYYPWSSAAHIYDSLLLSAYALARQEYIKPGFIPGRESIEESLSKIIYNQEGEKVPWNKPAKAIKMIFKGKFPDIEGASSHLKFNRECGVEPIETIYEFRRIETRNNLRDFYTLYKIKSSEAVLSQREETYDRATAAGEFTKPKKQAKDTGLKGKEGLWAVIISTTSGWENYRHQSDACAFYDMLKQNGVGDDRILFYITDDLPWLRINPLRGDIHHEIKGKNLRRNAFIDYSGQKVTVKNLENVLLGNKTESTPVVLGSDDKSSVFIYIVGHGSDEGAVLFEEAGGEGGTASLGADEFAEIIEKMYTGHKFRRMLIMAEACFGEKMGLAIKTPHVLFFTGA